VRTKRPGDASAGFQVVIMAKAPVAGAVKTRLCPPLDPHQAAALAMAALLDTVDAATASGARRIVLALAGAPGPWVPDGVDVIAQRAGDFGARLAGAIDDTWAWAPLPPVVVGMDTPQLSGQDLDRAAEPLLSTPGAARPVAGAVLGPAEDGGYWTVGVRRPVRGMFDGVTMSTSRTGADQLARLAALRVPCSVVHCLRDVDEFGDALVVAGLAPSTRFAAALHSMVEGAPVGVESVRVESPEGGRLDAMSAGRRG